MVDRQGLGIAVERVERTVDEVRRWRPVRVALHFTGSNGTLLAAGMAYQSLFAAFAAVWIGFSLIGLWLHANSRVFEALIGIINDTVPGLIGSNGAITAKQIDALIAQFTSSLQLTAALAAVGLLWTLIGWLSSTRIAIRTLFGLGPDPTNFVLQKLRDLGLAFVFGVVLVVAAAISVVSTQTLTTVLGWVGISAHSGWTSFASQAAGQFLVLALNFLILCAMYRVLSHVVIPLRNLVVGALIGATALSVLSLASGLLLGRLGGRNTLLASFATFVGLLIWFNLICIVILFGAAWISVGMSDRGLSPRRLSPEEMQHQRMVEMFQRRLALAQEDVAAASDAYERTRGWGRARRRKALFRAYQHLRAVRATDPDADPMPANGAVDPGPHVGGRL